MVNSTDFAKRLQKILDEFGLSASSFAEEININRSTISHLISGRNKPSLDFVMKVVERFPEVNIYWLLNGKGTFPAPPDSSFDLPPQADPKKEDSSKKSLTYLPDRSESDGEEKEKEPKQDRKSNRQFTDQSSPSSTEIERIIIFYKNGSFKEYLP